MKANEFERMYHKTANRTAYLVAGFIRNTLNDYEQSELDKWADAAQANLELFESLTTPGRFENETNGWHSTGIDHLQWKITNTLIKRSIFASPTIKIVMYAAAAACIAAILFFSMNSLFSKANWYDITAKIPTLTLPDGTIKELGIGTNDTIINKQAPVSYNDRQDSLFYSLKGISAYRKRYHILQVPAGFKYFVVLQDGTKVWLNENTVIRFPEAYDKDKREVELRGEAFFEIAGEDRPFNIKFSNGTIITDRANFDLMDYKGIETAAVFISGDAFFEGLVSSIPVRETARVTIEKNGKIVLFKRDIEDVLHYIAWKDEKQDFRKRN